MPDVNTGFAPYTETTSSDTDSLPSAIPLERHLLSALISAPELFDQLPDNFTQDALIGPNHSLIFDTAKDAAETGAKIILPLVQNNLPDMGGPRGYLTALIRDTAGVTAECVREYAEGIMDAHRRRRLISAAQQMMQDARSSRRVPVSAILSRAVAEADHIAADIRMKQPGASLDEAIDNAISHGERSYECGGMIGTTSGFSCINRRIGGFEPAKLYLLGARPGMGKTALAVQIAMRMSQRRRKDAADDDPQPKNRVHIISLEMDNAEIGERALALAAHVPLEIIRSGEFKNPECKGYAEAIVRGRQIRRGLPIYIDDEAALSVAAIRLRVKHFIRKHGGLELLIIDHLGYISRDQQVFKVGGEVAASSAITKGLKSIAKEFGIPILLLAQLTRDIEKRDDKRPLMTDIRGSGTIEEDCNVIMFLYRRAYYDKPPIKKGNSATMNEQAMRDWQAGHELIKQEAELIFGKVRHGKTGIENLIFDEEYARFSEEGERPRVQGDV